ncbi:SHOCT domain-containing protein [Mycolicibacterium brisbanense]|uniref:Membrane protein n=1 Tax=Mycolicibacterium brisbanense TaxID=146020 RepID=A0A124DZE3_9MYCO|nr:SHOCT domain-containing protein [Mycolicibacterium brisbanense]MCV7159665.1 SHOCT domain-containing protein [Mycolicibacterium brisbanense]GAS87110.1 membrane protein [Mycolicibacterium brisbanense]
MVGRYLKAQLWVLLCGGLVGPIFLIVYFAIGESDLVRWMFWAGLLITAADVLVALAMTNYGAKSAAKSQFLEQQGVLALAQVIGIAETGTQINDQPLVKLDLRIEGPGLTPFESQDRVIASVTRLPLITSRKLVVLVDPATNDYQIDWQRSALVGGLVPAQFTVDEDHRTYDLSGQAGPLLEILRILKANNVPMNGTVDIRSNPVVRQQVTNVVRRAAAQQAPAAAPAPAPTMPAPEPSTAQRLQELETLRATGAITDTEYTAKRQQIIAEF